MFNLCDADKHSLTFKVTVAKPGRIINRV